MEKSISLRILEAFELPRKHNNCRRINEILKDSAKGFKKSVAKLQRENIVLKERNCALSIKKRKSSGFLKQANREILRVLELSTNRKYMNALNSILDRKEESFLNEIVYLKREILHLKREIVKPKDEAFYIESIKKLENKNNLLKNKINKNLKPKENHDIFY